MDIHGFVTLTLLDYPGHLGATLFLGSCNFRCPFCQNGNLVLAPECEAFIPQDEVLAVLKKKSRILEGVCISGGEPTLHRELPAFIRKLKEMGYLIKLDTNGTNPEMLQLLYDEQLLDYVAMDIKSSLSGYAQASGLEPDHPRTAALLKKIEASVVWLMNSGIDYEFRTTVVKELHSIADFEEIGQWIAGCRRYYLQPYQESEHILAALSNPDTAFHAHTKEELKTFQALLQKTIPIVEIRGLDFGTSTQTARYSPAPWQA